MAKLTNESIERNLVRTPYERKQFYLVYNTLFYTLLRVYYVCVRVNARARARVCALYLRAHVCMCVCVCVCVRVCLCG